MKYKKTLKKDFNFNNKKLNIHIAIPTYNRPEFLLTLIKQIYEYRKDFNLSIFIYNDCSTEDYSDIEHFISKSNNVIFEYKINEKNFGREFYSLTYNNIFNDIKDKNADYYIQIPDDVEIVDDFFNRAIKTIIQTKEEVINIFTIKKLTRRFVKLKIKKVIIGNNEYWESGWIDGAYIAKKSFFEKIGYHIDIVNKSRWKNKNLGSGTCNQIVKKYKKRPIYQLTKSLLIHKGFWSEMRKFNRDNEDSRSKL